MSRLVHQIAGERQRVRPRLHVGEPRILHATAREHALHGCHRGPRIFPQIGRQLLHGIARISGAAHRPRRGSRVEAIEAEDVDGVRLAGSATDQRACGVPHIAIAGAPREVAHVRRREVPRHSRRLRRERRSALVRLADRDHRAGAARLRELRARAAAEDRVTILQRAGRTDDPSTRRGDAHIVIRRIHVELRLEEIRIRHPPVHIVVDRDLRVPVAHEVEMIIASLATIGRRKWRDERPREIECGAAVRHERRGERHPHHRPVHDVAGATLLRGRRIIARRQFDERGTIRDDARERHPIGERSHIPARTLGAEHVLAQIDGESRERIRRVVDVDDALGARECVRRRVDRRIDRVACVLHPVAWPRLAGARTSTVRNRTSECRRDVHRAGNRTLMRGRIDAWGECGAPLRAARQWGKRGRAQRDGQRSENESRSEGFEHEHSG